MYVILNWDSTGSNLADMSHSGEIIFALWCQNLVPDTDVINSEQYWLSIDGKHLEYTEAQLWARPGKPRDEGFHKNMLILASGFNIVADEFM